MARVKQEGSWIVAGQTDRVVAIVREFLRSRRLQIVEETEDEFRFKQGSQFATRLRGGWFVPPPSLPKSGRVGISRTNEGVRIEASIEESLGFGIMDPLLKDKYRRYFEEWMGDLRDRFE